MTQEKKFNDCVIAEFSSPEKADLGLDVLATDGFTSDTVSRISFGAPESQSSLPGKEAEPEKATELDADVPGAFKGNPDSPKADRATAVGGLFGSAERWGVRRDVAAEFESKVRNGSLLVVVTDTPQRLHEAYKLLQTAGPLTIGRFRVPDQPA